MSDMADHDNSGGNDDDALPPAFHSIDSFTGNFQEEAALAHRPCPVCRGDWGLAVTGFKDFQFFSDDAHAAKRADIRTVRCAGCHALYMNPCYTPHGFATLFREAGMSYGASGMRYEEQTAWLQSRNLLRPGMRLMDIGCYEGAFIRTLPEEIATIGVDIDAGAIDRAREAFPQPDRQFVCGDFTDFAFEGTVDIMTMFHVLEHLPDPRRVLARLRLHANADTRLVVEVPVLEHGITNDINGFFSVQHLTHFSKTSLAHMLAAEGWAILEAGMQKGYNGYRVLAAPAGDIDIPAPDAGDIARLQHYLSGWYGAVADICRRLDHSDIARHCVIWGGGLHTEFLYQLTPLFFGNRARRFLIVDSDPLKQGASWRGIPIAAPAEILPHLDWRETSLIVSSYGNQQAIADAALELGARKEKIILLYDHIDRY